jgi:hypothetical protein
VTYVESRILLAIDNIGWYAYLWFPIVHREYLNFGSHTPDSDIHRAFISLIRKGSLLPVHDQPGDMPDWLPSPEAFGTAVYKALGRKIREPVDCHLGSRPKLCNCRLGCFLR